jgi:N-acetylglutamate synthase-like GNAT family acetyltransferase
MIKIRSVVKEDLEWIKELHKLYYSDLDMPDFNNLLSGFVIEDEKDEIIMAGGVEAIGEALLITDKSKSQIKIGRALVEAQRFAMFTCANFRIKELYAFTENENYKKHLKQHGFIERNEPVLRLKV